MEGGAGPCPATSGPTSTATPAWRDRARAVDPRGLEPPLVEDRVEETDAHADAVGIPLDRLAAERGTTPFDLMLDLALADDMATRFRIVMENDGEDEIGELLADKRTLLGLSDAGAHASQLCDACYSTHLLGHWVRERKALSLEDAVWRLTGHPHEVFRLPDRGLVQEGFFADLVAFDPETVGTPRSSAPRPARRRRPAGRAQHRGGARLGQRGGRPARRCGPPRRRAGRARPVPILTPVPYSIAISSRTHGLVPVEVVEIPVALWRGVGTEHQLGRRMPLSDPKTTTGGIEI